MREFVLAMHEIWTCWRDGSKLSFEGDFYTHKLMTPMFTPEPHDYDFPKMFIAAVGEAMTEMAAKSPTDCSPTRSRPSATSRK